VTLIFNFEIYETNYRRYIFQISLIVVMWIVVQTTIKMMIVNKIGKKVFFY
jgi:hypothetical protein